MARGTTTKGRVETTADPVPTTVTWSLGDAQSSGSLQYETASSPKGGTVFMPPWSSQRRDTQLPVPQNTQGWTPYTERSFIQCYFFFKINYAVSC